MKYFSIAELVKTSVNSPNVPGKQETENLKLLIENVLDPLRAIYGKPIRVNSGYRSVAVNKAVGGTYNSQHLTGCAADITAGSPDENKALFEILKGFDFDQLIDEYNFKWVHVSFKIKGNRKQILYIK